MKTNPTLCVWLLIISSFLSSLKGYAQEQLTNLPTLYITTEGREDVENKHSYVKGNIVVKSSDSSAELNMVTEIRGRGNSTWMLPKKPYRIKLDKKTRLLNLPAKARSWTLLANYGDKSLIRNAVAFEIGKYVGMEWTPAYRFVDLYLNDKYLGNYMLTDQVEVRENRVPVEEQEIGTETLPDISGGYLLEMGGAASGEPYSFLTSQSVRFAVKYPQDDEINNFQFEYIMNHIEKVEEVLFSENFKDPQLGYRAWIDENSLINWYIASELTGNPDAFWSTYLYKYRENDKLFFGPLWDYDIAFNNDDRLGNAERKIMLEYAHEPSKIWIKKIWQDDWFKKAVKDRWIELIEEEKILDDLLRFVKETHRLINASQRENYLVWNILGKKVFREYYVFSTYEEELDYIEKYLKTRVDFLTNHFTGTSPDPFILENYYYLISNRTSNTNLAVADNSQELGAGLYLWENELENVFQHWTFIALGNNKYQIINRGSELAITGNGEVEDLNQTSPDINNKQQIWSFTSVAEEETYAFINEASGLVMDNRGGGLENGNPVIEFDNQIETNYNQQWLLGKIAPIEGNRLSEVKNDRAVIIYPNPVKLNEILSIKLPDNLNNTNVIIEVVDIQGRSYFKRSYEKIRNNILDLSVRNLNVNCGLYVVKVLIDEENYNYKLIRFF